MAEPLDGLTSHARRPLHQDSHSHDEPGQQHQDLYPNPFQQPPRQRSPSQQHYSILIPTVDHWPRIALEGLARGAVSALDALSYAQRTLHTRVAQLRALSSSSPYHVLPTSSADLHSLSPFPSSPSRRTFSFGSKRQQKQGHRIRCSSRRWTRVTVFVTLLALFITLIALPTRLNPFRSRVVWVRYYTHEESVKIVLPYGVKVHVSDVKATAVKAMSFGYDKPLGQVKLISTWRAMHPGDEWNDNRYDTASMPLIATETGYELYEFLDNNLNCFTGYPSAAVRFKPEGDNWSELYFILHNINKDVGWRRSNWLQPYHISYLRSGFNDPEAGTPVYDMTPFTSKRPARHRGFDHPHYAPSQTMPPWIVQPNATAL